MKKKLVCLKNNSKEINSIELPLFFSQANSNKGIGFFLICKKHL